MSRDLLHRPVLVLHSGGSRFCWNSVGLLGNAVLVGFCPSMVAHNLYMENFTRLRNVRGSVVAFAWPSGEKRRQRWCRRQEVCADKFNHSLSRSNCLGCTNNLLVACCTIGVSLVCILAQADAYSWILLVAGRSQSCQPYLNHPAV